jgi:hypothetical protein
VVTDAGAWSPACAFAFDTFTIANPPIVEGIPTEEVEGETYHVLNFGESAEVTFRPHPDDVGSVHAYEYSLDVAPGVVTVLAGPDGAATITLTNTFVDGDGVPVFEYNLTVRAVSVSGAHHSTTTVQIFNLVFA